MQTRLGFGSSVGLVWATCKRVWCRRLSGELIVECLSRGAGFKTRLELSFCFWFLLVSNC
jgi:hypothetical protein